MEKISPIKNAKPSVNLSRGFTLIELLVVIAILGLLASILLVSLNQSRAKARDAKRVADLKQITTGLEFYYDKYNQYPSETVPVTWDGNWCDTDAPCQALSDQNWDGMIASLRSAGVLSDAQQPQSWWQKLAEIIPNALAAGASRIQDPSYPNARYMYMPSAPPQLNQNYRLRVKLEDPKNPALQSSIQGKFFWAEDYKATGPDSCDPTLGFYCTGAPGNYQAFLPGKPVIYLYPTHTEKVSVNIKALSVDQSIPAYQNGWSVLAHPNGQIQNLADGLSYPYLYWEGQSGQPTIDRSKGFVVADKDVESFLMDALAKQGLKQSEAKEFIDYWAPRMHGQPYVYVYFMPKVDYDKLIPMDISPKPDTTIRVYMLFKQLRQPITVSPEQFTAPARKGFTVVEWGGDRSQLK